MDASDWLDLWVEGWVASRGIPAAAPVPDGWHAAVGESDDVERTFLCSTDALESAAARSLTRPSRVACLVPLDDPRHVPTPPGWSARRPDWLMTGGRLTASTTEVPAGYRASLRQDSGRAFVLILTHDPSSEPVLAAAGQIGFAGSVAVPDRVRTEKGHRRRGLGRAVMRMLSVIAAERGADVSVLSASDDGRALYQTLGWTTIARFPSFVREP